MRKGQVTLYIIIGLILVILIAISSYIMTRTQEVPLSPGVDVSGDFEPIKDMVQFCLKKTTVDAVHVISEAGGYYENPKESLPSKSGRIAYHYYNGQAMMPSKSKIEEQISMYIEDALRYCLNYRPFLETGFEIEDQKPVVTSYIQNNTLFVSMNYILKMTKGDMDQHANLFRHDMPFNLDDIMFTVSEIIQSIEKDPWTTDLTLLAAQSYPVQQVEFSPCSDVYIIMDSRSFRDSILHFRFAVRYPEDICMQESSCDDLSIALGMCEDDIEGYIPHIVIEDNRPPVLDSISPQRGETGILLQMKMNATDPDGDMVFYLASGILEDTIDVSTGMISFIPIETGYHEINITAVDIYGATDTRRFQLEIS